MICDEVVVATYIFGTMQRVTTRKSAKHVKFTSTKDMYTSTDGIYTIFCKFATYFATLDKQNVVLECC